MTSTASGRKIQKKLSMINPNPQLLSFRQYFSILVDNIFLVISHYLTSLYIFFSFFNQEMWFSSEECKLECFDIFSVKTVFQMKLFLFLLFVNLT